MKWIACAIIFFLFPLGAQASKSYDTPESMSSHTREPQVRQNQGATVYLTKWLMTVPPETFSYDVYFEHGCRLKTFPLRIGRYWQVSNICEFWPKSHYNLAAAEINRSWMITYQYAESELGVLGGLAFPESSLKIVFSDDNGESWEMLRSSVVDEENNTVAAITDKPGGYMVMAGFVKPDVFYSYSDIDEDVLGATTTRAFEGTPDSVFNPIVYAYQALQAFFQQ
ncbi:hypothetical protein KBC70_03015 [Candidatus Woesebacteria bacterium]|nr:hypothetical protein [Candidatus Woesebacteria bacterium]